MLFLIFDVNEFVALAAFANISAAVGLVQVDSVLREGLQTVGAFLGGHLFHFS